MSLEIFDKETVTKVLHSALAYQELRRYVVKRINNFPPDVNWTDVISYFDLYEIMKKIESEVCNNDEQRKG